MWGLVLSMCIFKLFMLATNAKDFWFMGNRLSSVRTWVLTTLHPVLDSKAFPSYFALLAGYIIVVNLVGSVPLNALPNMHYCFSATISVILWVSLVVCVVKSQIKSFIAHMLPYGAPAALMLFLPLVEIFSHIIRPMTLMIRLSTNLSSGHIMLYIFSYFTLLGSSAIYTALFILIVLEYCVVIIQSYIFVSLVSMYLSETY